MLPASTNAVEPPITAVGGGGECSEAIWVGGEDIGGKVAIDKRARGGDVLFEKGAGGKAGGGRGDVDVLVVVDAREGGDGGKAQMDADGGIERGGHCDIHVTLAQVLGHLEDAAHAAKRGRLDHGDIRGLQLGHAVRVGDLANGFIGGNAHKEAGAHKAAADLGKLLSGGTGLFHIVQRHHHLRGLDRLIDAPAAVGIHAQDRDIAALGDGVADGGHDGAGGVGHGHDRHPGVGELAGAVLLGRLVQRVDGEIRRDGIESTRVHDAGAGVGGLLVEQVDALPDEQALAREVGVMGAGGAHASTPEDAVDVVTAASSLIQHFLLIPSRRVAGLDPCVVSTTWMDAGRQSALNVYPPEAHIGGVVRTHDDDVRDTVEAAMRDMVRGLETANPGLRCELDYLRGYDMVWNDPARTAVVHELCEDLFPGSVITDPPMLGGEDFAAFSRTAPATYVFVGAGNAAKGFDAGHHNPRFGLDEDAFPIALRLVVEVLRNGPRLAAG